MTSWLRRFAEIGEEARDPKYFDGANDEDVHTFVIRKLSEKVGALSRARFTPGAAATSRFRWMSGSTCALAATRCCMTRLS